MYLASLIWSGDGLDVYCAKHDTAKEMSGRVPICTWIEQAANHLLVQLDICIRCLSSILLEMHVCASGERGTCWISV